MRSGTLVLNIAHSQRNETTTTELTSPQVSFWLGKPLSLNLPHDYNERMTFCKHSQQYRLLQLILERFDLSWFLFIGFGGVFNEFVYMWWSGIQWTTFTLTSIGGYSAQPLHFNTLTTDGIKRTKHNNNNNNEWKKNTE